MKKQIFFYLLFIILNSVFLFSQDIVIEEKDVADIVNNFEWICFHKSICKMCNQRSNYTVMNNKFYERFNDLYDNSENENYRIFLFDFRPVFKLENKKYQLLLDTLTKETFDTTTSACMLTISINKSNNNFIYQNVNIKTDCDKLISILRKFLDNKEIERFHSFFTSDIHNFPYYSEDEAIKYNGLLNNLQTNSIRDFYSFDSNIINFLLDFQNDSSYCNWLENIYSQVSNNSYSVDNIYLQNTHKKNYASAILITNYILNDGNTKFTMYQFKNISIKEVFNKLDYVLVNCPYYPSYNLKILWGDSYKESLKQRFNKEFKDYIVNN